LLCDKHSILLIFDEIVTGFRLAYGGAQEKYGVVPDICTLGKIIGGGFPLAALGASADIMRHFDKAIVGHEGWLMQLGTLSGNPVASAAGRKTMEVLRREGTYERLRELGTSLQSMQSDVLRENGIFKSLSKLYPSLALTNVDLEKTKEAVVRAANAIDG